MLTRSYSRILGSTSEDNDKAMLGAISRMMPATACSFTELEYALKRQTAIASTPTSSSLLDNGARFARVYRLEDDAAVVDTLADREPEVAWNQRPGFVPLQVIQFIAVDTVLPVERWMLILAAPDMAERVGVLATVKDKAHCRARACGPP